jgi:uncharacterized protein YegL
MPEIARTNSDNPEPRIACALLLDTSSSMYGQPIDELNRGFEQFVEEIAKDDTARKRAEIMVITFGGTPTIAVPFTEARNLTAQNFIASGGTPMGGALQLAITELEDQKRAYKQAGIEYYRPWLFVLTDGEPTDSSQFDRAAEQLIAAQERKSVAVFAIGVGPTANMSTLAKLSSRAPMKLTGLAFTEYFQWLSQSLSSASQSQAHGSSDSSVAAQEATEQISLPPVDWSTP